MFSLFSSRFLKRSAFSVTFFSFCIVQQISAGSPAHLRFSRVLCGSDTAVRLAFRDTSGSNIHPSEASLAGYQLVLSNPLSYCFLSFKFIGVPKQFLIFVESGGNDRLYQLAEWFGPLRFICRTRSLRDHRVRPRRMLMPFLAHFSKATPNINSQLPYCGQRWGTDKFFLHFSHF